MDVLILGATGGSAEISGMLSDPNKNIHGHRAIGFLEDKPEFRDSSVYELRVLGEFKDFDKFGSVGLISGIGNVSNIQNRFETLLRFRNLGAFFINCISSSAVIVNKIKVDEGIIISPLCYVGSEVQLESFVYVMPNSVISHHSLVGNSTIICSGVTVAGNTSIGRSCYIGAGTTIGDHLELADNIVVGAGSNVVSNLQKSGVYYGNPARWVREY